MEASSHGIDQRRLDGVHLTAAGFLNLTLDHLDYHGSLQAYRSAKLRLFETLLPRGRTAVLNADCEAFPAFAGAAVSSGQSVLSVGEAGEGIAAGAAPGEALAAFEHLQGAPGRLQRIGSGSRGGEAYVDYAHTPDGLSTVLAALRPHAKGRLIVVFGAGGDRDRTKRPLMGAAAVQGADLAIVTDDNPRSEDPAAIRAAILAAAPGAREIGDRREAIFAAASELRAGDVLVVAGKGHEQGQIVGGQVLPFDDAAETAAALAEGA